MTLCLNCNLRPARNHPPYGLLPCLPCTRKQAKYRIPETIEITTGAIKESRKEYSKDILQKYRGGTPSLEYARAYGGKGMTKEELKEARNVWGNDYYSDKTERYNPKSKNKV